MIGKTISHYKIKEKLGSGGMGIVYKAKDLKLDRFVALKFLPPELSRNEESKERFIHEAKAASALDHPNICTVFEIGETEKEQLFIAMAYYEGETLKKKIERGSLEINEAVDIAIQIAEGLEKAHEKSIIHRDIKPANIHITKGGTVKILDFGLAKLPEKNVMTSAGTTLGTVAYMSPEQTCGEELDKRSDIWSLGVVFYEMLTGQLPFKGDYEQAVIYSILNEEPVPLSGIDERLQHIISKALAKNLDNRYKTTDEILNELRALSENGSKKTSRKPSKIKWIIGVGSMAILIAVVIYLFLPLSKSVKETETIKTIAVLPFVNMSSDSNQEYFSDGLSEELINTLSRNPKLRVTARTSSFYFKGKDVNIKTIAQTLNVNHILEGSVRKSGNNLRITADLVNAETDATLWSNTYNGTMDNIFALQDSISGSVAEALKTALLGKEPASPELKTDPEAYNLYLLGNHFRDMSGKQNWERAISYYKQALSIDSTYAPAWEGLGIVYTDQGWARYFPNFEIFPKARKVIEKALEFDPSLAAAYSFLGYIKLVYYFDWKGAEESYKRAQELDPGNMIVNRGAAVLASSLGQFDKAIELTKRAIELDPVNHRSYFNYGINLFYGGQLDESILAFRKSIELDPQKILSHMFLGQVYLIKGQLDSALTEIKQETDQRYQNCGLALVYFAQGRKKEADSALLESKKEEYPYSYQIAHIFAFRGETDKAFEWLERAYNERDDDITLLKGDPFLKNIRKDPRFAAFMKKINLPM